MAANLPVDDTGEVYAPALGEGEFVLCAHTGVRMELESGSGFPADGGCYYGSGILYLTNFRLVHVNSDQTRVYKCLSMPLSHIKKDKFKSPWIGTAYFKGKVDAIPGQGIHRPSGSFRFDFVARSTQTDGFEPDGTSAKAHAVAFMERVTDVLQAYRDGNVLSVHDLDPEAGEGEPSAFVDPNDPFAIYITGDVEVEVVAVGDSDPSGSDGDDGDDGDDDGGARRRGSGADGDVADHVPLLDPPSDAAGLDADVFADSDQAAVLEHTDVDRLLSESGGG